MRRTLFLSLAAVALLGAVPFPADAPIERADDVFPVEPGVNAERGFAVALDGDLLAVGAPLDDGRAENAGAVYLFRWVETAWELEAKLHGDLPHTEAVVPTRFGSAVALAGDVLAVAAMGEGAVYLFLRAADGSWGRETKLQGTVGQFGRAVALAAGRLAVGSVHPHGRAPGVVHLYTGPPWTPEAALSRRRPGERFGEAVALAGDHLVVGAPGHSRAAGSYSGAAYIFQLAGGAWKERAKLLAEDGEEGDQLGAAVAAAVGPDGTTIALGAPTADGEDTNRGAVYVSTCAAGGCAALERIASGARSDALLGSAVAAEGDLLAAGAPGSAGAGDPGALRIFRRAGASWVEDPEDPAPLPGNAEMRDLVGFAVALDGDRAVVGGVLGDQGDAAAGAAWSLVFEADEGWREEAEAVARDPLLQPEDEELLARFGVSAAAAGETLVVGALRGSGARSAGAVYVYRSAGDGWRQEGRLTSPVGIDAPDGFGTQVATDGESVLVAAPSEVTSEGVSPPFTIPPRVYLFSRSPEGWRLAASFFPASPAPGEVYGASLAIDGDLLAIGAPSLVARGGVYIEERAAGRWAHKAFRTAPAPQAGDGFGAAVALQGRTLAIGAPGTPSEVILFARRAPAVSTSPAFAGAGAVYVVERHEQGGWSAPVRLGSPLLSPSDRLGAAVALGEGVLAAGAPGRNGAGAVLLFTGSGASWSSTREIGPGNAIGGEFGASVALEGGRLLVGAPAVSQPGRAHLYRQEDGWVEAAEVQALRPRAGDRFGAAVALPDGFLAVTSPGPASGDRAALFKLRPVAAEVTP